MSSNTFYRIAGICLIASAVFTISTFFMLTSTGDLTPTGFIVDVISYILLIPGFLLLYQIYKSVAPLSSLAAVIIGIIGIIIYGILSPLIPQWKIAGGLIGVLGLVLPIFLFGIFAYQNPHLGMSRSLGITGILTGILGIVNVLTIIASGGDWQSPNNPGLASIISISYSGLILLSLIWSAWTGVVFLSQKSK